MSTLHLTSVNPAKRAVAITAVKAALVAAGGDARDAQLWREAQEAVFYMLRGGDTVAVGLVQADDDIVHKALAAFKAVVGDSDAATVALNIGDAEPKTAVAVSFTAPPGSAVPETLSRASIDRQFLAPTPTDFDPTYQAARSALLLMQMTDGKPIPAWFYAKQMACATEQPAHWVQVGNLIIETFGFEKQAPDDE